MKDSVNRATLLAEFHSLLLEQITSEAGATNVTPDETFFRQMTSRLEAAGEMDAAEASHFAGVHDNKQVRVDGSSGDPDDNDGVLSLVVCVLNQESAPRTINAAETRQAFSRLLNFVAASRQLAFRGTLAANSPALGLASLIAMSWSQIEKLKLLLVTNCIYSIRTDAVKGGTIGDIPYTYNVWDLDRFYRYDVADHTREDLLVDFREHNGSPLPCLLASSSGDALTSYLLVVPGAQLAELYERWGSRLLESNVRSFLQARGKINQGIRDSIKNEPQMFFSYNNGLSATATAVDVQVSEDGTRLAAATNLQIVNGGQTTASLHAASRATPSALEHVHVQMKLTVIPGEAVDEIVPRISQFANSQNRINAADFFSNHPFHVFVEDCSRRILAPALEHSQRPTKWFYERARGQYHVERSRRPDSSRKLFDADCPKSQLFSKTDLAKVEHSFRMRPDLVSKGAEKNFSAFAKVVGDEWSSQRKTFNDGWYHRLIAKLIVFKHLERNIPREAWYPGGYRANLVTYAIAKLTADMAHKQLTPRLDAVWSSQSVSRPLEEALFAAALAAMQILLQPPVKVKNVSEWAKLQACWEMVRKVQVHYMVDLASLSVRSDEQRIQDIHDQKDAVAKAEIEAQKAVLERGSEFWVALRQWNVSEGVLSPKETETVMACESIPLKIPSGKQCVSALASLEKASAHGFRQEPALTQSKIRLVGWSRS